jgi:hypothetical protein
MGAVRDTIRPEGQIEVSLRFEDEEVYPTRSVPFESIKGLPGFVLTPRQGDEGLNITHRLTGATVSIVWKGESITKARKRLLKFWALLTEDQKQTWLTSSNPDEVQAAVSREAVRALRAIG